MASFTRSDVGRVARARGATSLLPLAVPVITRMCSLRPRILKDSLRLYWNNFLFFFTACQLISPSSTARRSALAAARFMPFTCKARLRPRPESPPSCENGQKRACAHRSDDGHARQRKRKRRLFVCAPAA
jgi:hypothetical protein